MVFMWQVPGTSKKQQQELLLLKLDPQRHCANIVQTQANSSYKLRFNFKYDQNWQMVYQFKIFHQVSCVGYVGLIDMYL